MMGSRFVKKKHGRTRDVLFRVHLRTSMNGFTEPQERFRGRHCWTGRYCPQYRGNTVNSRWTAPCHDTTFFLLLYRRYRIKSQRTNQSTSPFCRYVSPPAHFFIFPTMFIWMLVNIMFVCDQCREGGWHRPETELEGNKTAGREWEDSSIVIIINIIIIMQGGFCAFGEHFNWSQPNVSILITQY